MIAQIKQLKPQKARRETERGKEREEALKKMRLKEYDEIEIEAPPVDRIESISSWHMKQWTQN
jgi:hypothetical protein